MKFSYTVLAVCCASLVLTSCKDVLDKTDLSSTNGDLIFKDSTLTQMNLD